MKNSLEEKQKRDEEIINQDHSILSEIYLTDEGDKVSLFSYLLPVWTGSD